MFTFHYKRLEFCPWLFFLSPSNVHVNTVITQLNSFHKWETGFGSPYNVKAYEMSIRWLYNMSVLSSSIPHTLANPGMPKFPIQIRTEENYNNNELWEDETGCPKDYSLVNQRVVTASRYTNISILLCLQHIMQCIASSGTSAPLHVWCVMGRFNIMYHYCKDNVTTV
jgi:hypothetical protein